MAKEPGAEPGLSNPVENVYASFKDAELADVSGGDFTITIGNGVAKALYVGTTGDVKVDTPNGQTIIYKNVPAGFNPISCTKVYDAGTTVTDKTADIIAGSW